MCLNMNWNNVLQCPLCGMHRDEVFDVLAKQSKQKPVARKLNLSLTDLEIIDMIRTTKATRFVTSYEDHRDLIELVRVATANAGEAAQGADK